MLFVRIDSGGCTKTCPFLNIYCFQSHLPCCVGVVSFWPYVKTPAVLSETFLVVKYECLFLRPERIKFWAQKFLGSGFLDFTRKQSLNSATVRFLTPTSFYWCRWAIWRWKDRDGEAVVEESSDWGVLLSSCLEHVFIPCPTPEVPFNFF